MNKEMWYQELGFEENPFTIKPVKHRDQLVGVDEKARDIIKLIQAGKVVFITGDYGRGKTSLLQRIIKRFQGQRKVAYFSGNQIEKHLDMDSILINAGGFFSRLFRVKSEDVILLLDEVQDLNQNDVDEIVSAYEEGYLKSVIIVSAQLSPQKADEMFGGLIGKNTFELEGLTEDQALELIKSRVGEIALLPDEVILRIHGIDPNPRSILKNCEDVCKFAVESGDEKVTEDHIEKVLL